MVGSNVMHVLVYVGILMVLSGVLLPLGIVLIIVGMVGKYKTSGW